MMSQLGVTTFALEYASSLASSVSSRQPAAVPGTRRVGKTSAHHEHSESCPQRGRRGKREAQRRIVFQPVFDPRRVHAYRAGGAGLSSFARLASQDSVSTGALKSSIGAHTLALHESASAK